MPQAIGDPDELDHFSHSLMQLIDTLNEKGISLRQTSFRPVKKDEPPSPQASLKKILNEGPVQKTFVVAFVDNLKQAIMLFLSIV